MPRMDEQSIAERISSLIDHECTIEGDIHCQGSGIKIDGRVKGDIKTQGETGFIYVAGVVDGHVTAQDIIIEGTINGDIHASKRLEIRETARITGNVSYARFYMEEGAVINGYLRSLESNGQPHFVPEPRPQEPKYTSSRFEEKDTSTDSTSIISSDQDSTSPYQYNNSSNTTA